MNAEQVATKTADGIVRHLVQNGYLVAYSDAKAVKRFVRDRFLESLEEVGL